MTGTTTIYAHPDGHEITVSHGLITAVTDEGTAVSLPLGAECAAEMAAALLKHSIAARHAEESADAAAVMAVDLVRELLELQEHPASEVKRAIADKLRALFMLEHAEGAAAGFAGILAPVLLDGVLAMQEGE